MKRFAKNMMILIVTILALSLVACGKGKSGEATYKDGTYVGESEKREFGYEVAEVTIKDDKIEDIVLKRLTPDGEEVDYEEWTGEGSDEKPNLKQFRKDVAKEMLEKQSYEVDNISTATQTVEGWKQAVKKALEQAKK